MILLMLVAFAYAIFNSVLPIIISVSLKWSAFVGNVLIHKTNSVFCSFFSGSAEFFPNYSDLYFRTKPSVISHCERWFELVDSPRKKNHSEKKKSNKNLSSSLFCCLMCIECTLCMECVCFFYGTKIPNCTHTPRHRNHSDTNDERTHDSSLEWRERDKKNGFCIPGSCIKVDTVVQCRKWSLQWLNIIYFFFTLNPNFQTNGGIKKKTTKIEKYYNISRVTLHKRKRAAFHCLLNVKQPTNNNNNNNNNDNNDALAKLNSKLMLKCVCAHYAYRTLNTHCFDLLLVHEIQSFN